MKAISLFSGMGGDSLGLVNAGFELVAYAEKEKVFRQTHDLNFSTCTSLGDGDITKIPDETFVRYANDVDMIFAGFPCFVKGTRVYTDSGYKPVEHVTHRDRLLTHTGVFRDIINIQTKLYSRTMNTIQFASGSKITCTEEHPFYVRTYSKSRRFSEPYWKPAKNLTKHDYCGMVINKRSFVVNNLNEVDEWFLLGYFVCNGWLSDDYTIGLNITDPSIIERIARVLSLDDDTHQWDQYKYAIRNPTWYCILTELRDTIPEWVHNAPVELLEHFVAGIGAHIWDGLELSLHMERIHLKLDNSSVTSAYIDGDYAWFPIEAMNCYESTGEPVYNFEVVIDNSYIVENRIVHNCQGFSNAGKRRDDDVRNTLFSEFLRATRLIGPKFIIGENVKGLLTRKMTNGQLYIDVIVNEFENLGYKIAYKVLKTDKYGIPQTRERLLMIGSRTGTEPEFPDEVPGTPNLLNIIKFDMTGAIRIGPGDFDMSTLPVECVLTDMENDEDEVVGDVHNYLRLKVRAQNEVFGNKTYANSLSFGKRESAVHCEIIDIRKPCKTIICSYDHQPRLFVPLLNKNGYYLRCLLPVELKQIQGFPADYKVAGNLKQQITQIGNAVPPGLIRRIAEKLTIPNAFMFSK